MQPMDTTEAAAKLGVSTETVRRWVRQGRLKAIRIGRTMVLARADVERFSIPRRGRPRRD